jgi:hypothetical protein
LGHPLGIRFTKGIPGRIVLFMERLVIVPAGSLDDLCGLTERAIQQMKQINSHDPLVDALQGALGQVRTHSMMEPVG